MLIYIYLEKKCTDIISVGDEWQPTSIVSYNHLGNNDGMNLSAPQTFRSKEISKSNVVDDMVNSNAILYEPGEHPDHVVVIKVICFTLLAQSLSLYKSAVTLKPLGCCFCSMCLTWRTARELWMSTLQRYSWVEGTQSCCTTHARIPCWLLQLSWTWSFLLSLALGFSSKLKERSVCLINCIVCWCPSNFYYVQPSNTEFIMGFAGQVPLFPPCCCHPQLPHQGSSG